MSAVLLYTGLAVLVGVVIAFLSFYKSKKGKGSWKEAVWYVVESDSVVALVVCGVCDRVEESSMVCGMWCVWQYVEERNVLCGGKDMCWLWCVMAAGKGCIGVVCGVWQ
ncbi:hypothetical protein E2C01_084579 [Portunus trituberculatus]|uniref:Transmembrane protein n=1 Tax=Portunus trituberculatus TaxID=210409 RepID=A0A5B7J4E6_PORTR|nr:hypothetical protein [Portunus trituberculatus]